MDNQEAKSSHTMMPEPVVRPGAQPEGEASPVQEALPPHSRCRQW